MTKKEIKNLQDKYFWVYMLLCRDGSLYTGMTKDVMMRFKCHMSGRGSRYVAARRPAELVYQEGPFLTRGEALKREYAIKCLKRSEKNKLVNLST